jgi:magnesium transporter
MSQARDLYELYRYGPEAYEFVSTNECPVVDELKNNAQNVWLNVNALQVDAVTNIATQLGLHELALQDILQLTLRPKRNEYDDYTLMTLKMAHANTGAYGADIEFEQISLLIFPTMIISFQQYPGDVFDSLRKKLTRSGSKLRQRGIDYLLYNLLDNLVNAYIALTDVLSDETDALETTLIEQTDDISLQALYQTKSNMMSLRKSLFPLRDILSYLYQEDLEWIDPNNIVYLRNCSDHVKHTLDNLDMQRELISNMFDIHLSRQNNKMNEVMKVLAIFGTIFIPLTFITGLYGMNFDYIPELKWHYGYYAVLSTMGVVTSTLVYFFKRKKWF